MASARLNPKSLVAMASMGTGPVGNGRASISCSPVIWGQMDPPRFQAASTAANVAVPEQASHSPVLEHAGDQRHFLSPVPQNQTESL